MVICVFVPGRSPGERLSSWYVRPMTTGWSGSPFRKSTITSWPTRGIARLPKPGPAHACDTLTQHELASVAGLYLSQ